MKTGPPIKLFFSAMLFILMFTCCSKPEPTGSGEGTAPASVLPKLAPETYFQVLLGMTDLENQGLTRQLDIMSGSTADEPAKQEARLAAQQQTAEGIKALLAQHGLSSAEWDLIVKDQAQLSADESFLSRQPAIQEKLFNLQKQRRALMDRLASSRSMPVPRGKVRPVQVVGGSTIIPQTSVGQTP